MADLEGRLKLCKCFGTYEGDNPVRADKKTIPFQYQNGSLSIIDNTPRISPSFSSTTSMCSGTSRSSSVGKDLSACSSPTIAKGLQLLSPYGANAETNRTTSPSVRLNASKTAASKSNETNHQQEKVISETQCPQIQQVNNGTR